MILPITTFSQRFTCQSNILYNHKSKINHPQIVGNLVFMQTQMCNSPKQWDKWNVWLHSQCCLLGPPHHLICWPLSWRCARSLHLHLIIIIRTSRLHNSSNQLVLGQCVYHLHFLSCSNCSPLLLLDNLSNPPPALFIRAWWTSGQVNWNEAHH